MGSIDIVTGSKEELPDDLQALARKRSDNPRIIAATGKDIRSRVAEKTSALFLDEREVLVLIDPEREVLDEIKDQIERLKERMPIIIYSTTDRTDIASVIKGTAVKLQGKDTRVRETIRSLLRKSGKKMTEKAFHAFIERVKEEGLLETELEKLIAYTGSKQTIDSKDLESVMIKTHEDTFFSLFDALAAKDRKKTIETLDHLVSQGLPLLAIHSFLVRQIRLLLHAKDMEEFSRARLDFKTFVKTFGSAKEGLDPVPKERKHYLAYQSPKYAYNLLRTSSKFTKQDLISFLDRLAQFDKRVKKGTRHERLYLEAGILGA